jgi:hypothetical protein
MLQHATLLLTAAIALMYLCGCYYVESSYHWSGPPVHIVGLTQHLHELHIVLALEFALPCVLLCLAVALELQAYAAAPYAA